MDRNLAGLIVGMFLTGLLTATVVAAGPGLDLSAEKGLVLVDFYADWCGPCARQQPELDRLAYRLGNSLRIVRVDIDRYPRTSQSYGVTAIPTLLLLREGQEVGRAQGFQTAAALERLVRAGRLP